MMHRTSSRMLLIVAAFVLFLVPVAAIAAGGFDDVPDDSVFKADIEWLADAGVTKGCNPPANTEFCPGDSVTREQMAAFMHRLAINKVVNAATAVESDNADTLDGKDSTAFLGRIETAADSNKLNGKEATAFVEHGDIVMGTDGHNWTAWGDSGPSYVENWLGLTNASTDGFIGIGLAAPMRVDGIDYGLKSVEVCYNVTTGSSILFTNVYGSTAEPAGMLLASDDTERTTDGCYIVTVNRAAPYGASTGVIVGGDTSGNVTLYGVRSTWTSVADLPAPLAVTGSSDDYNNG